MLNIGSYKIPSNVLLAPMAGCADLSFRLIAREHGAKFAYFEMIDVNSILYGSRKRLLSTLVTIEEDAPVALQLLGHDPDTMLAAAKEITKIVKTPFLDINAACPVKKVVKRHAGAYFLKETKRLAEIIKALALNLPMPITVKLRTGYEKRDPALAAKVAKACEANGAAAIFVHGRTKAQMYSGEIDYASIRAMKESVKIPVFGSGNVFDAHSAEKMLTETACDGVMVARGALGNPWIFDQIDSYLKKGTAPAPVDFQTRKKVLRKHLSYIERYKEVKPSAKVGFMRKAALWYLKGVPDAAQTRHRISLVKSYEKMLKLIDSL